MIIIFNIAGLLIAALGVFLGLVVAVTLLLSGSPVWFCPGMLTVAVIWCAFGRAKLNPETGEKRPAPALFFIPLIYLGLLVCVLSVPMGLVELTARPRENPRAGGPVAHDPRLKQFSEVKDGLSRNDSDDEVLSALLTVMIAKVLPGEPVNIAIKSSESSVLVLMKLKDLKKIKDSDRKLLLNGIRELAETHRPAVKVFAGIKGKLLFGGITVPGQPDLVGASVDEKKLLAFFDQPAATDDNSKPETSDPIAFQAKTQPEPDSDSTKPADGEKHD